MTNTEKQELKREAIKQNKRLARAKKNLNSVPDHMYGHAWLIYDQARDRAMVARARYAQFILID